MNHCPYLTDLERHIQAPQVQDQYRHFAVFNLHGVRYIRWFNTDMDRAIYLSWIHRDLEVISIGEEPSREDRALKQRLLDSIGPNKGLRLWPAH